MSRLTQTEIDVKKALMIQRYMDDDFIEMTDKQKAESLGISIDALMNWKKDVPWEEINKKRQREIFSHKPAIDMALLRNAKKGKERSIELAYQIFFGWNPKTTQENINRGEGKTTFEELQTKAREILAKGQPVKPEVVEPESKPAENG